MAAPKPTRRRQATTAILLVDDHPVFRRGLAALLASEPDLTVCGEAATGAAALQAIRQHRPDLVILDLQLEGSDGLALMTQLHAHYPELSVLVLSMHEESLYAERVLRAGARGYVTKAHMADTVLRAIRRVLDGELYLSEQLGSRFAAAYLGGGRHTTAAPLTVLSNRELEVFRLLGQGQGTHQIAQRLGLSIKTIESHREHLKQKLTCASGAELVRRAIHWVDTGQTP